jgi:hypothetical protein
VQTLRYKGDKMRSKNIKIWVIVWISFYLTGCATTKISPDYFDPSFSPANVDFITILPIADLRKDRSADLGEDWEHKIIEGGPGAGWSTQDFFFAKLGYNIVIEKDFGGVPSINEDDFIAAEPSWVKKLGPKDARWILLVVLERFVSQKISGNTADCSATLYDKESGKAVWQHKVVKGEGGAAQGGVALGIAGGLTGGLIGVAIGVAGGATAAMIQKNQDTLQRIFFSDLIAAQFPTEHGLCVFCVREYKK